MRTSFAAVSRSPAFAAPAVTLLFGHRTPAPQQRLIAIVLLLAGAALAAAAVSWALQRQALAAGRQQQALPARAAAAPRPAPAASAADSVRINRVVRRLNTPWASIFEALEAQASRDVAVVSIETDVERGSVRVMTEGPSLEALLAHAERVQASPRFLRTQLLRVEPPEAGPAGAALSRLSFDLMLAR